MNSSCWSIDIFKEILNGKKARQVGSLYFSTLVVIILGVFTSVINTRFLGPQQYGDLKFIQTLFNFAILFFTLGLFVTGSRLVAQKENENCKERLIGTLIVLAAIIGIVMSILVIAFSFFQNDIFGNRLSYIIRLFAPFLFVYPFNLCLENILQGDNRIYALSVFRWFPSVFYLTGALAINYFYSLTLFSALMIEYIGGILFLLIMIPMLNPDFSKIKKQLRYIWDKNKQYGLHVYLGVIIGTASAHLGGLSIAYYVDNTNVGFFTLSLKITMPLTLISAAIGNTFFKDFANLKAIPIKASLATATLALLALAVCLVMLKPVVHFLYTEKYSPVVALSWWVSIGAVFHGFGDFVNRFLGAHGKGKELRNGAIVTGLTNVLGFTILIKSFGVQGAAITRMFSGIAYWAMMYYYYRRYLSDFNEK